MEYRIRRKTKDDCASVAHVVTVAWNETYKGIVNDDFFMVCMKMKNKWLIIHIIILVKKIIINYF